MAGPRRRSREIALQILHEIDVSGSPGSDVDVDVMVARYFEHLASKGGPALDEDEDESSAELAAKIDRPLIQELVRGVTQHWAELDESRPSCSGRPSSNQGISHTPRATSTAAPMSRSFRPWSM